MVAVASCACGLATVLGQNACGTCVDDNVTSLNPQCEQQIAACASDVGCSGSASTLSNNCTAPDEACLNSLNGTLTAEELKLLSDVFECLCVASVCGTACDPGPPAFSCEVTVK